MNLPSMIVCGIFIFAIGACVGSFLNVVIWRLPYRGREIIYHEKRGRLTLSWPPSHCPICDAPIAWYQNIPIFSWLFLRGRCANCRTAIPIRYPLVELATALVFISFYLAYFIAGWQRGISDFRTDWPPFALHLIFASALLAGSAIDADLFIIPLSIPWFLAILGLIGSGLIGPPLLPKYAIIPNLEMGAWWLAKPIAGAALGLILANVLMLLGLMPRSFDGPEHELSHDKIPAGSAADTKENEPLPPPPKLTRFAAAAITAIVLVLVALVMWGVVSPKTASFTGVCAGILVFLLGVLPRDAGQMDVTDEVMEEISSPGVRSEVSKEILFLAVPVICGVIAHFIPLEIPKEAWIGRVLGSLMGLLVGGGVVWLIRVAGSLAFGKEAMGMGDAHLMAGVGAVIGAPLVIIAFFTAPFLGIFWAILLKILGKPNVLPYVPWLSIASILMLFVGNPIIAMYFSLMFGPRFVL